MASEKLAILPRISLFSGLTTGEIEPIAQLLIERRYAAGDMLFWEGEECAGMFLIAQGEVKIFKTSPSGRELVIGMESAPSSVAELPLFDGGPYPASARAVSDVVTYFINKSDFHQVCCRYPDISLKILATPTTPLHVFKGRYRVFEAGNIPVPIPASSPFLDTQAAAAFSLSSEANSGLRKRVTSPLAPGNKITMGR
jgi:hypothetical protein